MNEQAYERMRGVREQADKIREVAARNFDSLLDDAVKTAGAKEGSPLHSELVRIFNQPVRRMENEGLPQEIGGAKMTLKEEIIHHVANEYAKGMVDDIEAKLAEAIKEEIDKRTTN